MNAFQNLLLALDFHFGINGSQMLFDSRDADEEGGRQPSESILFVSDVRLYKNDYGKAKIDFTWSGLRYPMKGVSLTDQGFYDKIDDEEICYKYAIIIISIPKDADWTHPETGERRAYKFVSKVFGSNN